MIVRGITIEGLGPYTRKQKIRFPTEPGVYLIMGRNEVQPHINPNGVGKSYFLEALCWCWFGKTSKALRASQVENWVGAHPTKVRTYVTIDGKNLIIDRHRNPNALIVRENKGEPRSVEQDELERILGIDYIGFLSTIMFAQFGTRFMDMSATQQASQLSRVLQLDTWKKRADIAKKKSAEIEAMLDQLRNERARKKAAYQANLETRTRLIKSGQAWAKQQDEIEAKESIKLSDLQKEMEEHKRVAAHAKRSYKESLIVDSAFTKQILQLQQERTQLQQKMKKEELQIKEYETLINGYKEDLELLQDSVCPTCGQEFRNRESKIKVKNKRIKNCKKLRDESRAYIDQLMSDVEACDGKIEKLGDKQKKVTEELRNHAADADHFSDLAKRASAAIVGLKEEKKEYKNPFDDQLRAVDEENEKITKERQVLMSQISKGQKILEKYRYWAKEFPAVRLWVLDTAAQELATYAGDALPHLGLEGWSFTCRTRATRASGAEVPEFGCMVTAPGSPAAVPFASWSGGESQLLRVAGAAGFSELAGARMNARPTLEIWDEPTAHMSDAACALLVQYLAHRAQTLGKTIFLIDHRVRFSGEFSGELFLVRDHHGTRVESTTWK